MVQENRGQAGWGVDISESHLLDFDGDGERDRLVVYSWSNEIGVAHELDVPASRERHPLGFVIAPDKGRLDMWFGDRFSCAIGGPVGKGVQYMRMPVRTLNLEVAFHGARELTGREGDRHRRVRAVPD